MILMRIETNIYAHNGNDTLRESNDTEIIKWARINFSMLYPKNTFIKL